MKILLFSVFLINYSLSCSCSKFQRRDTKIDWSSEDVVLPEADQKCSPPATFQERKTLSDGFQGPLDYPADSISRTKSFTNSNYSFPARQFSIPIIRRATAKDIRLSQEDIVGVAKEEFPGKLILIEATED